MILNARFEKHWGQWDSVTGKVIAYRLEFESVYHALKFLEPYEPGDYMAVLCPVTEQVTLEPVVKDETMFEFGPPWD